MSAPSIAAANVNCAGELMITVFRDGRLRFEGSAAELIDEGLIPNGFEWPRGRDDKRWEKKGFEYHLRRTRPEGHKGPLRSWLEMDNWSIRVWVAGRDFHRWRAERELERKAEELEAERYSLTPAGRRERREHFDRLTAADGDPAFQRFKLLVPGLVRPKRGRKPRADSQSVEANRQ